MATISPSRPSRRAATSRRKVVDSSDEDENGANGSAAGGQEEDNEEFTPSPRRSPRRQSRRITTNGDITTPQSSARGRRTKTGDSIQPSVIFEPDESNATNTPSSPTSPTKNSSPRKRKSMAPSKSRQSIKQEIPPPLMTPQPSTSPEPSQLPATPLAGTPSGRFNGKTPQPSASPGLPQLPATPLTDITNASINEKTPTPGDSAQQVKAKLPDRVLDKPMDIVLKSRAMPAPPPEPATPKARTVIKFLVLQNFKSYAGRQEVGPFHASFSSVVGPNGSGKSNVIDSLLFVFGFRASKMRQGKVSALIHNSAGFPNLDYCEVEVHFQEVMDVADGKHEIMPGSDLIISRKAFKNNSSKYYINGKTSDFTTVTTLLRDRGVDLDHKRFLILQGEVESIAQMKPKAANEHDDGLLEYLEDIIGTSQYKSPIEESAAEVETLNEVCVEKSSRVQHVEKERNNLEDKKNKALAYIKDENELSTKQSALYQIYIDECGNNLKVTDDAIAQMQAQLDDELKKHEGNEAGIKDLEKSYKRGVKACEALEKETQFVVKEMAKFDKENVKFEERKKFLTGKQKKLEKALHTSTLAISESKDLYENYAKDVERNATQIAALEKTFRVEEDELVSIRNGLKGKTQVFSDQIAAKQKSLEPWKAKINEKQSAIAVARSELEILHERNNAGAVALEELQERIQKIEQDRDAKVEELNEAKGAKATAEKDASQLQGQVEKMSQQEKEIRSKISGARQKADEARASLSNSQTQGNVLSGLMRLKESGRINGFHGRLGNLGAIDQRYDVAISTACPSLDNLVVDSVEVGQQCIDHLRKNNLGRANFILLDRLAQRDLSAIDTPEGVPRLFDLVKPQANQFRPAFFSVLQNTLVAKDLEQANRIAYGAKRWRVVTLDGQLIDKSGTMTGGGTRVSKGAMSSKIVAETSKEQVSKLEQDRDALERDFKTFTDNQRELEISLKKQKNIGPQLEIQMQKTTLEIESLERNLADAKRRLKELDAENKPSKSENGQIATIEKQISTLEKERAKLSTETSGVEEEIKTLQDKIMEIGGVKLRSQKVKVDSIKEQIDTLIEETSSFEVSKAKAGNQHSKHEKICKESEEELSNISKELEKLGDEISTQSSASSASREKAEQAQMALEIKKDELANLKKELDEKAAELNEIRGVEIEMRNKLEENQKTLAENHKRSRYWHEKLSKLTIQSISDLEGEKSSEPEELPSYSPDELADMDKDSLKASIAVLEEKTQASSVELGVLAEYRRRVDEHTHRSADLATAVASRDTAKRRCDDLRQSRLEGFMQGFSTISLRLKEMYQMITMGGNAELELVDSLDPFSEGILFSVMPPKKSWKNISNLSGGEKTLSSLALVFALHHYKPTPLYVMDEIDAALDFRNVSIVASYIKERTKNAQFIVISLRNNMFELASRLVGVYKVNHMTKSITIENQDYITNRA
ncbi:MAG: hypothetical protein M4579_003610 [Chaenotheca gracillima]|nr:MAG: hypothetical protein M4579_003610 [Chaenotheca gracillima]